MRRSLLFGGAVAVSLMIWAGPALAAPVNVVQNGSFEQGNYTGSNPGCECDISPSTSPQPITAWTVVANPLSADPGSIDWLEAYPGLPPASDGVHNLDMSGNSPGAIEQSIATVAGATYTVSFDLSSNPNQPTSNPHVLQVRAGGVTQSFTHAQANLSYDHDSVSFTATSSSALLEFISADNPATASGPVIDNVAASGVPTQEDQCADGGWMQLSNSSSPGGSGFSSQAACDAFATGTTVAATPPNGQCNGLTLTGTYNGDITVPAGATCVFGPGFVAGHDVTVQQGATFYDEGATIEHDFNVQGARAIDITAGSQFGHDVNIQGLTGAPPGEAANEICGATVAHDFTLQNGGKGAPIYVGCGPGAGNQFGHDVTIQNNAGTVWVLDNAIAHNLTVQNNTGGTTVDGNTGAQQSTCQGNTGFSGTGNAGGSSCNAGGTTGGGGGGGVGTS